MISTLALAAWVGCQREPESAASTPTGRPKQLWPFDLASDLDGDGWPDDEDCSILDEAIYPGAPERCNGIDDDCDGAFEVDGDGDSFLSCADCDDTDPESFPGGVDPFGDRVDSDCDGTDGVGLTLGAPIIGPHDSAWYGYSLAAGDLDSDGCDDLVIGQPDIIIVPYNALDSVTLTEGCFPWQDTTVRTGERYRLGNVVDTAGGLLLAHEWSYRSGYGRLLLFDAESFRAPEQPSLLEVLGDDWRMIHSAALLGDGPSGSCGAGRARLRPARLATACSPCPERVSSTSTCTRQTTSSPPTPRSSSTALTWQISETATEMAT